MTPARPGKEHALLTQFLSVYERDAWRDAGLRWLDEEQDGAVELLATRHDGATLAIEHTLIQPTPREKEDFARFDHVFLRGARDRSLERPGTC